MYTQAVSVEQEVHGLIDMHSGEQFVPPGLLDSSGLISSELDGCDSLQR